MAEVLGVAASGISVASLAIQICDSIQRIKEFCRLVRDAPKDIKYIVDDLSIINSLLPRVERIASSLDTSSTTGLETVQQGSEDAEDGRVLIKRSVSHCKLAVDALDELVSDLHILLSANKSLPRRWHSFKAVRRKDEIESVKRAIASAKSTLNLVIDFQSLLLHERHQAMMRGLFLMTNSIQARGYRSLRLSNPSATNERVSDVSFISPQSLIRHQRQSSAKSKACTRRSCLCSCHAVSRARSRFWLLELPSLSTLWNACDHISCTSRQHHAYIWVGLTRIGIPFAISASLEVLLGSSKFSISPSLAIERIVKYTSPGFELLWKCKEGFMRWPEARENFEDIIRSGKASIHDINPGGHSLLEVLLRSRWCWTKSRDDFQVNLLGLLVGLGAKLNRVQLLLCCAEQGCTDWRLSLIHNLVGYGFDGDDIEPPNIRSWPSLVKPADLLSSPMADPFFVEFFGVLLRNTPGFGGNSSLSEAILGGSQDDVEKCLSKGSLLEKVNFLGQSALHLAVARPQHLDRILTAGLDVDVQDYYSLTPLTYAAATGQTQVALQLLAAGADAFSGGLSDHPRWLKYAAGYGHWELIMAMLHQILFSSKCGEKTIRDVLDKVLVQWAMSPKRETKSKDLQQLLEWKADVNVRFVTGLVNGYTLSICDEGYVTFDILSYSDEDCVTGNTLLHCLSNSYDVDSIIKAGFSGMNHENSEGLTPLMAITRWPNPNQLKIYIDNGSDIHRKDHYGLNTLHLVLRQTNQSMTFDTSSTTGLDCYYQIIRASFECAKVLLLSGANTIRGDACLCRCSNSGCMPVHLLYAPLMNPWYMWNDNRKPIWTLEWLTMLQELRTKDEAKTNLLGLLRSARFNMLGLTHVCCRRSSKEGWAQNMPLAQEDAKEIIAEEEEIIQELEIQMADLSAQSYDDLQEIWLQKLKAFAVDYVENSAQHWKNTKNNKRKRHFEIDYENDRFIERYYYQWPTHIPDAVGIKLYVGWLEYCKRYPKEGDANDEAAEEWYQKRLKWSSRLLDLLEELHLGEPFEPIDEVEEVDKYLECIKIKSY